MLPSLRRLARTGWVALLLATTLPAVADPIDTPTLRWRDRDGGVERDAAPLALAIRADVSGLLAEVVVTQRFTNDGAQWREGQYLLPLPEGAAVHTLKLRIGARVVEGEIREKHAARAEYAAAARAGRRTSLVEQAQANLFRTAVANVGPGETVDVEVGYWQRVRYRDGRFALTFPLGPRGDAYSQQLAAVPPDRTDPTVTQGGRVVAGRVAIDVALEPGLPIQSIESLSHPINVDRVGGTGYAIRLHDAQGVAAREFELGWRVAPTAAPQAALFVEHAPDADYALVMLVAPPQAQARERLPRELVLVIDTSGSMLGAAMEQARAAADLALSRLAPGDRFNVIEFNTFTTALHGAPVDASAANVAAARAWVGRLQASGGTEMLPALDAALAGAAPATHVRQVVFVTDGAVTEEDGLYTLVEESLGAARLFPVGIGDAPNARFLEQAARMGRGAGVVIRDLGEVRARMQELFDKLDSPTLRDVALDWPAAAEAFPERLPDLYAGEPLIAVARLPKARGGRDFGLAASGRQAERAWHRELALDRARDDRGVARLWAKARIDAFEDALRRGGDEALIRPRIVDVALAHHLVTRYTSLVAVERAPARPEHAALEGLGADDTLALAQGATPAPLALVVGLLGALLAGLGRRLPARRVAAEGRGHA
jgi:Ca-activated chloride channel family protein